MSSRKVSLLLFATLTLAVIGILLSLMAWRASARVADRVHRLEATQNLQRLGVALYSYNSGFQPESGEDGGP